MATNDKNTAKNTAPVTNPVNTPKVQTPPVAPTNTTVPASPAAPSAPAATEKAAKVAKVKKPLYFDTEALATAEAASRTEGARRAFKVTFQGKDYFMVVHNWEQAVANVAKDHGGATYNEAGKVAKVKEEVTGASIAAMLEKLSETDRKQVEEALAKLAGK